MPETFRKMPFLLGLLAGVAVMLGVFAIARVRERQIERRTALPEPPAQEMIRLRTENEIYRQRLDEMSREDESLRAGGGAAAVTPVPAPPSTTPTPETPAAAANPGGGLVTPEMEADFVALAQAGMNLGADPKYATIQEEFRAAGAAGSAWLVDRLLHGLTAWERFLAAAYLEGLSDPSAISPLAESLRTDSDSLVRRMSSHGLAILGTEASRAPLAAAMETDPEWGVKVNSAYGLAKMGDDQGAAELLVWYEEQPDYRLAILGGLADAGHPSSAPLFRQILAENQDMGYQLFAIQGAAKLKDVEAVPLLDRLISGDPAQNIREAAEAARRQILEP